MIKEENEDIKKASEVLEAISQNPEERLLFEARQRRWRDEMSLRDYAKKEGLKEGKLETAKRMLKKGFSIETIIELTGLSNEDLETLVNN